MERNTITTLGQLRTGDRFTFVKKDEVWQVTGSTTTYVTINKFTSDGKKMIKFDEQRKRTMHVRFLRHTMPQPGEKCLIQELNLGDVFTTVDNIINEYFVREHFKDQATPDGECKAVKMDDCRAILYMPHGTTVIFIRSVGREVIA
jgi:hypothetical protein